MLNRHRTRLGKRPAKKISRKLQNEQLAQSESAHLNRSTDALLVQRAMTKPHTLPPKDVLRLQGVVGNQATRQLVGSSPTRGKVQSKAIQRFPANVLTTPINWNPQTFTVEKSGEGVSGGVSFFRSNQVQQ